jgi:hypothetical protein
MLTHVVIVTVTHYGHEICLHYGHTDSKYLLFFPSLSEKNKICPSVKNELNKIRDYHACDLIT